MIINQVSPLYIATITGPTGSAQSFQTVTTYGGTPNGQTAGAVTLGLGKGLLLGVPFTVRMAGYVTVATTAFTLTPGLSISGPGGAAPTATAKTTAASATLTAGASYNWFADFVLSADGVSQTTQGYSVQGFAGALSGPSAVAAITGFTGFPAVASQSGGPYSWVEPITGIDSKINNGSVIQFVPQITSSVGTSTASVVGLTFFGVLQG